MDNWGSLSIFFIRILQISGFIQLNYSTKERKIYRSKLLVIYSIVLLITLLIWLTFCLNGMENTAESYDADDIGATINYIHLVGAGVGYISAVLESLLQSGKRRNHFQTTYEIDELFKNALKTPVHLEKHIKELTINFMIIFSIYSSIQLLAITSILYFKLYHMINYWILYTILSFMCAMRYFEVYASAYVFKWRFDQLNDILCKIKLKSSNVKSMDVDKSKIRKFGFYNTNVALQTVDHEKIIFYQLVILRDIYHRLWELTNTFNDTLGFSLLINIGCDFISLMANFYWIFISISKSKSLTESVMLLVSGVALIPHAHKIILIARACYLTVQSANKTALLIHKVPIESTSREHNIAIEQFSLQILHQKIAFSAFRFFDIDLSLLYAIAGAITTYLVILIQFHMSSGRN